MRFESTICCYSESPAYQIYTTVGFQKSFLNKWQYSHLQYRVTSSFSEVIIFFLSIQLWSVVRYFTISWFGSVKKLTNSTRLELSVEFITAPKVDTADRPTGLAGMYATSYLHTLTFTMVSNIIINLVASYFTGTRLALWNRRARPLLTWVFGIKP